ncbi:hypothetical protein J3458_001607 [Metarhizium acridum]|uniref:uncharacterized protein n=1 Tax=Metarhizium acridum TaxID=92637 RepID=UPI001C6D1573|nr:hypothetical protein J3458_001607 [Metarhizium acridum]
MAGLPPGWEWDYDGQRWFYKYKPTGQIQYHFPSEGDEFPNFIEAGAPAPDLAPEERLESQQQVKRQTSSAGSGAGARSKRAHMTSASNGDINKYAMSATAKPVSAIWEGDDDAEADGVFQPENFMFLGPGTYTDVSPLAEEEEEAAKRSVVGAISERVQGGETTRTTAAASATGVSPPGSSKTTPMMAKSEPLTSSAGPADASIRQGLTVENAPVTQSVHIVQSEPLPSQPPVEVEPTAVVAEASDSSVIHMIDSREMPVEMMGDTMHRFDPVGFVAEMPTEHTAAAHIELYPEPVEIADNTVLAPVETAAVAASATAIAVLTARNSPVEGKEGPVVNTPKGPEGIQSTDGESITRKNDTKFTEQQVPADNVPSHGQQSTPSDQPTAPLAQNAGASYANQGPRQGPGQYGPHSNQHGQVQSSIPIKLKTFKIARKQPGSTPGTLVAQQSQQSDYQAYVPGQTTTTAHLSSEKRHSIGLQREASLMMNMEGNSIGIDPNSVPRVLSPPQHPVPNASREPLSTQFTKITTDKNKTDNVDMSLAHAPSVLKPARNRKSVQDSLPQQQVPTPAAVATPPAQPQPDPRRSEGISKFPSVLRPARGRSSSHPGQAIASSVRRPNQHTAISQDHLPPRGRVYQVNNNQTTISTQQPLFHHPLWATAHADRTVRPASAMPIINHVPYGSQYSAAGLGLGLIPQGSQSSQPSLSGCQPPEFQNQPSPLQHMQEAIASQPRRPQTVVPTIQPDSANTANTPSTVQPQQPVSVRPLQQIQDIVTEQLNRPQSVPAVFQPLCNISPLQRESVDSQLQVQPAQQVREEEAGRPQPQPQPQHRPSISQSQLTPTQLGKHVVGEQPNLPQNLQIAANIGTAVETQSLPTQQEPQKKLPPSLFKVQPLQQTQNAEAGQPSQLKSLLAPLGVAQRAGGHAAPAQQESSIASQFQVQPLQDTQNAASGQISRPKDDSGTWYSPASDTQTVSAQHVRSQQQQCLVSHLQSQEFQQAKNEAARQHEQPLKQSPTCQFQESASYQMQNDAARQPPTPQSVIGTIQHSSPPKPPKTAFAPDPSQPGSGEPTHPGMRRASVFASSEVSPARTREDSVVSTLGSPLRTDSARHGSSNPTINDPNYTPSPLTDTTGPLAQDGWAQSIALSQRTGSPPVPAKIREHAEGSFFPVQNTPDVQASQDSPPTLNMAKEQQQDTLSQLQTQPQFAQQAEQQQPPQLSQSAEQKGPEKRLPQKPAQDTEHPIGYQVKPLASRSSQSLNDQQTVLTPGSGHILGRIEERDESEQGPKIDQTQQVARPSSMSSSIQRSIPDTPASSHTSTLHHAKSSAPTQIQRPVQTIGQSPMASAPLGQPPSGQPPPIQEPQNLVPPGHMQVIMQTQVAPGQMAANLIPQGQWNPPVNHSAPTQESQEKERKWSKWFKGGHTKPKSAPQQMMSFKPGLIPGSGPQPWTGSPYGPNHFWQQPGQQRPFGHGQSSSVSDSASISTLGSDKKSQDSHHVSPGQVPAPIHADTTGQLAPEQMMQGQPIQGQMRPGQVLQGQGSGQIPPVQMHPRQQLPGQALPGQIPSGRGYFGRAHPLQLAANPPLQGFTSSQPHSQHQGRVGIATQGSSNPNQSHVGHSRSPSTVSQAGIPQQGVPPQQVHTTVSYPTQHSTERNMIPPPLFAPSHGDYPESSEVQSHLMKRSVTNNKWAQRPAADYSGGDWGDEENWERR